MTFKKGILLISAFTLCISCKDAVVKTDNTNNHETIHQSKWLSLMNAQYWRGYNTNQVPENWKITDTLISCVAQEDKGGDLMTDLEFDNFELRLDWKISTAGNSGILYHVVEYDTYSSCANTGPEYQLIDDVGYPEVLQDWQKTGADYAMYTANDRKKLKLTGSWNSTRIIFNKGDVEHWLNGEKIVTFNKNTKDWLTRRDKGKWKDFPHYAKSDAGHIGLQDHGAGVWFKNIRIKRLP